MTSLGAIIAAMGRDGDVFTAHLSENWMQGRTAYGGASSALALTATEATFPQLPPLRSAQIAFVGPLGGELTIRPTLLRQGRSASFVRADVSNGDQLGLSALFLFASERESALDIPSLAVTPPARGDELHAPPQIAFTRNFEVRDGGQMERGFVRWARIVGEDGLSPAVELIAVADILPPAALVVAPRSGPISSITWQLNLVRPLPVTDDGWWLTTCEADQASNGLSAQAMAVYDASGNLVATASQTIGLYF